MPLALRLPAVRLPRFTAARAAGRRSKSRATVAWGAAAVVAAAAGLGVAVETTRPHWRDPEFGHRLKQLQTLDRWRRHAAPDRPLVVLVGSSRPALGFSPAHLGFDQTVPGAPVVYNFAHSGYGPGGVLVSVRRLLDRGIVPDRLLVEIHPPALSAAEVDYPLRPEGSFSLSEVRHLAPYSERPGRALGAWAADRARSWYTLRHSLLSHAGLADWLPQPLRKDFLWESLQPLGWMPYSPASYPAGRRTAATARAVADHAPFLADFRVAPAQDRVIRDLLAAAAGVGAKPALLLMPESPEFRAAYPPGSRDLIRDYLAGLSREYAAPVFDTSEWIDDEAAFLDGHHLLGPAAEAFSRRLGRECVGPWLGVVPHGGN